MSKDPFIELRVDFDPDDLSVVDAVVQATPGASRSSVMRQVLREWVERKVHEATLIHRVAAGNGNAVELQRQRGGNKAAAR